MASIKEQIQDGINKYQTPQGNPKSQLNYATEGLIKMDKVIKDKVQEAGDIGSRLIEKGKKMLTGKDISEGLPKK